MICPIPLIVNRSLGRVPMDCGHRQSKGRGLRALHDAEMAEPACLRRLSAADLVTNLNVRKRTGQLGEGPLPSGEVTGVPISLVRDQRLELETLMAWHQFAPDWSATTTRNATPGIAVSDR